MSIIVCARNEAENLREHLPLWLDQTVFDEYFRRYSLGTGSERSGDPRTSGAKPHRDGAQNSEVKAAASVGQSELIIVDDGSEDESVAIVRTYQRYCDWLRLIELPQPSRPGKKAALTAGIQAARNEFLLLTDADCRPASRKWAALMIAPLNAQVELVLGYSPYLTDANLLGRWQAFETTYTARQYIGFAHIGLPYMGVGRNLAYCKHFFERANGFQEHARIAGGDDDLLVSQSARAGSTEVQIQKEAWTYSKPANSWPDYWRRKRRHLSVGIYYKQSLKILLGGLALSHGLHYLLGLILLIAGYWQLVIMVYLVRIIVVLLATARFPPGALRSLGSLLFFDAALCFYYLFSLWATLLAPPTSDWSSRN
ncbi:MAG: glycosyltransferase [Bacteroidota bacterium]